MLKNPHDVLEEQVIDELRLPRLPHPQPSQTLHQGGDCGACVIGGLLGLPVPEVYQRYSTTKEGAPEHFNPVSTRQALQKALCERLLKRIAVEIPWFQVPLSLENHGPAGWTMLLGWYERLAMAIDGGYYGVAGTPRVSDASSNH